MSSGLDNWAKKYEEATNSDETIGAMAKYYSCSFMFDMEKAKVIIEMHDGKVKNINTNPCLLYTSPSPRDRSVSRMPSSA